MCAKIGWAGCVDKLVTVQGNNPVGPALERLLSKRGCQNLLYLRVASVPRDHKVKPLGLKARKNFRRAVG